MASFRRHRVRQKPDDDCECGRRFGAKKSYDLVANCQPGRRQRRCGFFRANHLFCLARQHHVFRLSCARAQERKQRAKIAMSSSNWHQWGFWTRPRPACDRNRLFLLSKYAFAQCVRGQPCPLPNPEVRMVSRFDRTNRGQRALHQARIHRDFAAR
jgi:hypothetical protein